MALTDNLTFRAALQTDIVDGIGGLTLTAQGDAAIQSGAPGPALSTTRTGLGYVTSAALPSGIGSYPRTVGGVFRYSNSGSRPYTFLAFRFDAGNYIAIEFDSSLNLYGKVRNGGTIVQVDPTSFSAAVDTWFACVLVEASATDHRFFVSGALGAAVTTSVTPSGSTTPGVRIANDAGDTPSQSLLGFSKYVFAASRAWSEAECQSFEADPSLIMGAAAPVITGPNYYYGMISGE